jgi:hypothetical protein
MKALVLSVGTTVALLAFGGTAAADHKHGRGHHGHKHHGHGHHGHGWGGGHYHYVPAHTHYHPDPWGGHLHYHPGRFQYHRGPDFYPATPYYRSWGYPGSGYGYRPGVSFGFNYIR